MSSASVSGRICGWTGGGYVHFIEPVQFLFQLYISSSLSAASQCVRFLVKKSYGLNDDEIHKTSCQKNTTASLGSESALDAEVAKWLIYMNIAALVPSLFSTLFLGGLSNIVGRKMVVILALIGGALRLCVFIIVLTFNLHVGYLVLSSVADGVLGTSCTMFMACFSYTSDITTHQQRSIRIVILQVFSGMALIVSSLATGFVIQNAGFTWLFVILLGVLTVAFLYVVFVLKESLVLPQLSENERSICTIRPFVSIFSIFYKNDGRGRRWCLLTALLVSLLVCFVQFGRIDVQILFLFTFPFCFTSVWIGYFTATYYFIVNVGLIVGTWTLGQLFGDVGLVFLGAVFGIFYELVFGFAVSTLMVFMAPLAGIGMILPISLLRAYISKVVEPAEVASAFACFAWFEMITGIVGGIAQNAIFAATSSWMPNVVFLFDAGVYAVTSVIVLVFLIYLRYLKRRFEYEQIINYDEDADGHHTDSANVAYLPEER